MNICYLGDCLPAMEKMKDNQFDLAIVDPPYGIGAHKQPRATYLHVTKKWQNPYNDNLDCKEWDNHIPEESYFNELFRISKNQIIWGGNNFSKYLPFSTGWIVWNKCVDEKEHLSQAELAYTSFNIRCRMFEYLWAGFKKAKQIKRIHPTQKPVDLYKWQLKNYAKPGDTILDTHVGSGSIRIACHDLGFHFEGWEKDPDYWEAQRQRFLNHTSQDELFDKKEIQSLAFQEVM